MDKKQYFFCLKLLSDQASTKSFSSFSSGFFENIPGPLRCRCTEDKNILTKDIGNTFDKRKIYLPKVVGNLETRTRRMVWGLDLTYWAIMKSPIQKHTKTQNKLAGGSSPPPRPLAPRPLVGQSSCQTPPWSAWSATWSWWWWWWFSTILCRYIVSLFSWIVSSYSLLAHNDEGVTADQTLLAVQHILWALTFHLMAFWPTLQQLKV